MSKHPPLMRASASQHGPFCGQNARSSRARRPSPRRSRNSESRYSEYVSTARGDTQWMSFSSRLYWDRDWATAELSAFTLSFTYVWICRWLPAYARPVESVREESLGNGIKSPAEVRI